MSLEKIQELRSSLVNLDKELSLFISGEPSPEEAGHDRKGWKHLELGSAVAERLVKMSIDMDTGEVTKSPKEIAEEMLAYCAPSYWRIKELNKIGLNADNFSETGELKTSIIVRKPKNT